MGKFSPDDISKITTEIAKTHILLPRSAIKWIFAGLAFFGVKVGYDGVVAALGWSKPQNVVDLETAAKNNVTATATAANQAKTYLEGLKDNEIIRVGRGQIEAPSEENTTAGGWTPGAQGYWSINGEQCTINWSDAHSTPDIFLCLTEFDARAYGPDDERAFDKRATIDIRVPDDSIKRVGQTFVFTPRLTVIYNSTNTIDSPTNNRKPPITVRYTWIARAKK